MKPHHVAIPIVVTLTAAIIIGVALVPVMRTSADTLISIMIGEPGDCHATPHEEGCLSLSVCDSNLHTVATKDSSGHWTIDQSQIKQDLARVSKTGPLVQLCLLNGLSNPANDPDAVIAACQPFFGAEQGL